MKTLAIVQARMGSTRLPGKVMMEVNGKPLIGYMLERIAMSKRLDGLVVALSAKDANSELAKYIHSCGVVVYSGQNEEDVAGRFVGVLNDLQCDSFMRLCADSPLIDPKCIDQAIIEYEDAASKFKKNRALFYSNVDDILVPCGQHIEIIETSLYMKSEPSFTKEDREHAGFPFFYRVVKPGRLCVDTQEDFDRIKRIIEAMEQDHTHYGWQDCEILGQLQ